MEDDVIQLSVGTPSGSENASLGSLDALDLNGFLSGGDGGGGGGSPKRGRGRPAGSRNRSSNAGTGSGSGSGSGSSGTDEETPSVLGLEEKPKRQTRQTRKGKSGMSADDLCTIICAIFNVIGMIRGGHWNKSPSDVMPFAATVHAYLETCEKSTAVKVAKAILPLQFLITAVALFAAPLAREKEIYEASRSRRPKSPEQTERGFPIQPGEGMAIESLTGANENQPFYGTVGGFAGLDSLD